MCDFGTLRAMGLGPALAAPAPVEQPMPLPPPPMEVKAPSGDAVTPLPKPPAEDKPTPMPKPPVMEATDNMRAVERAPTVDPASEAARPGLEDAVRGGLEKFNAPAPVAQSAPSGLVPTAAPAPTATPAAPVAPTLGNFAANTAAPKRRGSGGLNGTGASGSGRVVL
jgi:hypothetical protein